MAPKLSLSQACDLKDFLGNHQKVSLLQSWTNVKCRAEELKVDHSSFIQMRKEKVLPKRLGKTPGDGSELEPFSAREDQAIAKLIRETKVLKEAAFGKAAERWAILYRETTPLLLERPNIFE